MKILSLILSVTVSTSSSTNLCQYNRLNAVKNLEQGVRGSNLGGWFILESWMSPEVWDENGCNKQTQGGSYLLEKCLGDKAKRVMESHWSTWIIEDDFEEMSKFGINLVRIPVGWWHIYDSVGGVQNATLNYYITPRYYTVGALKYIDEAFKMGMKYGIAILLDLHAAPGSQNGNDHSSPAEHPGIINWDKYPSNVGQAVDSMGLYAKRYGNHPALFGFGLLNEPAHVNIKILQNYYIRAYRVVRKYSEISWIVINPLITPFESGTEPHWLSFMNPDGQGFWRVAMDLHYYSCFGGPSDKNNSADAVEYVRNHVRREILEFQYKNPKKMLIGEWSACGHFPINKNESFAQVQADVYGTATMGWVFWSWTDGSPGNVWSLKTAFKYNWIGKQYPCS